MIRHYSLLASLILTLTAFTANAGSISVTPMLIDMNARSERVRNLTVTNTGNDVAYVQVDLGLVKNPDNLADLEKSNDPSKLGLLVSPKKIVIPVGQSRLVRLVNLNSNVEKDKYYAIKVSPVEGDFRPIQDETGKTIKVNVKVKIDYLIKVFVRPDQPLTNISLTRTGNKLKAVNNGTTNGVLYDGSQCKSSKECKELPGQRLFPGQTWETTLPFETPLTYSVNYGDKEDKIQTS